MTQCPNHNNLMDKIDKIIEGQIDLRVEVAGIPEKIFDKADSRYATKLTEAAVNKLIERSDKRTYDWLKFFLTAIGSAGLATVINHYK